MLWVDNYRPKTLDKVLFHEDIAQNLKKLVSEQDCPHLLFYGPLGSGKKTLIMALLREMFGASAEKEPPASVIDSNGAVTGHIILTIIGGKNGEPKQDIMMKEMHKQGITINDISKVLKTVPIHPRIVPTIKAAHAAGCDLRIVSDANRFFIETILSHLGLRHCFTEINTNPGYVDEQGRLRILPFHDFNKSCHGCNLCPPNMCKGKVIKRLLLEQGHKRFIYLGDGSGDYCPSLKLRQGDHVMPRKNFPVWDLISSNPNLIRAQIHEWIDGEDLEKVVMSLIPSMSSNGDDKLAARLLAIDCKLETMPVSPHESLPKALPLTY